MREIELEEGEAYFPQDDVDVDDDDDENIDPDKDFSYIDKKIESVLGHYQKDFMGGLSTESLGARYGGYGSFLPMQQRSPAIFPNQRTQSQITSKSPHSLPSENPTVVANNSMPLGSGPTLSDHSIQALPDSGTCTMNNQSKLQSSHDGSSNDEKPMVHHTAQKSLKLRVKMGSQSVFSRNNSAIYSGLGLETSPCSSLEDSPSDSYECSPGMQEMKAESPSYIVKIMTSFPLPNKEILSPLHHTFVCLEGKSKANKDGKSKVKDPSKDQKPKKEEHGKERKGNKLLVKPVEFVKENHEYPTSKREERATSLNKEVVLSKVTTDTFDAHSCMSNKKYEVGCLEEVTGKSMQQVLVARDKAKGKFDATSSRDSAVLEKGNVRALRGKMEEENFGSITSKESHMDQRNEVGPREGAINKLLKEQAMTNDKMKDVALKSRVPTEVDVHGKENGTRKKILEDVQAGRFPTRDVEGKDKFHDLSRKVHLKVEAFKPAKQKSHSKVTPHAQLGMGVASVKEHSPSLAKKKSRESQTEGKSKKDGTANLQRDMWKDSGVAANVNSGKKEKALSMKETVMGVSDREAVAFNSKLKEKASSKKVGFDSHIGISMEGHMSGGNSVTERVPVGDVSSSVVEDWVLCEKCEKWRLLPLGMNPDSLPKEWICSMLTWLPGKNTCSVSEEETNDGLRALYQAPVLGLPMQNIQPSYPDGTTSLHISAGAEHVGAISSGGRKKNLVKTKINASKQTGFQEHFSVEKDQLQSSEMRSSKHQRKLIREFDASGSTGDCKPSELRKKRVTEHKASGVPKKMKRVHQQSVENVGLSTGGAQSYDPGAQKISNDFTKSSDSPLMKAKDRTHNAMTATNIEMKDVSWRKRKLKDQYKSVVSAENLSGGMRQPVNDWSTGKNSGAEYRKEKKFKVSNVKCSEKAFDVGLSDSATNSSSTKVSLKIRAKVKCSPIGSISSSPFKVSKSDHRNEPEKFSVKQLKPKAEEAIDEIAPHIKEEMRDRKSNLSRNSGIVPNVIEKPKLEAHKNTSGKVNRVIQEGGSLTSQHKLVSENRDPKSIERLHFHENNSEKGRSHVPLRSNEKESACHSHVLSESERVDNRIVKLEPTGPSSSMKKEIFHFDANTALKEATNLREAADPVKIPGSGLESTGVLFQAALNFLHGASLLEPSINEGGKYSELTPTTAYTTAARCCEQRAHEYERCNDMASAALAYKCMEVAYMKVVYSNDLSASRDRVTLDTAIRAAPRVDSPSSSASDIDSLNNQAVGGTSRDGKSVLDQQNHVIYAGNRPNFVRLLNFTQHVNLAMEASRMSQSAFAAAKPALVQAKKGDTIPLIKSVLDFSFHDIDGLLHLMRLAMEALNTGT